MRNLDTLNEFNKYFRLRAKNFTDHADKSKLARYKKGINWFGDINELERLYKNQQLFLNDIRKEAILGLTAPLNISKQERHCMELLAQGRTMKEIGRILGISPRTVESYIRNIKDKTGCNFKSQIIDLYHQNKS